MQLHRHLQTPCCGARRNRAVVVRVVQADRVTQAPGRYVVSEKQKEAFKRDGFVHLEGVLKEEEMAQHVDPVYFKFLSGDIQAPGKDKLDAAVEAPMAPHANLPDDTLLSVMLPRVHHPSWQGNLLEKRAQDIACQLLGTDEVDLDFDQILAKRPRSRLSGMPWHQDAAAWPEELNGSDCATANMWVAVSDAPVESGCLRYVPGSHREGPLRPHEPVGPEAGHMMRAQVGGELAVMVPMKRGDIVVHSERVVHGSGPNLTDKWRCGYILNFKRSTCMVAERALGAADSNTDDSTWQVYQKKTQN